MFTLRELRIVESALKNKLASVKKSIRLSEDETYQSMMFSQQEEIETALLKTQDAINAKLKK